ncbi:MAG: efflux RND transporter periplasmic adaptor subunit [Anaerolineales bacterium]|nr:efflux RND transporter periplasmic adaptor subunit [Anaerolineales bacterium]
MKRFLTILLIVIVIGGGLFAFGQYRAQQTRAETLANLQTEAAQTGSLTATVGATGVVHSNQSATLTWGTSGTVGEVAVRAGDSVTTDQALASINQTTLPQNVILAQADLVSAQKALDDLYNLDLQKAQAEKAIEDAQKALDDAQNPELQQALALQKIADAQKTVDTAERNLRLLQTPASQADIDAAKAQVVLAKDALDRAQDNFDPWESKPEDNLIRANLLAKLSAAQQSYDAAVRNLNGMLANTASATDLAVAEADVATAQAQLLQAQRDYEDVKDGPSTAEISLLEAQLSDAQKNYDDLNAGPDPDDVAAAQARIDAAQATLDSVSIKAPFDGTISEVNVKPGDLVSPGSVAFKLDDLSRLLVDVEVSEVDINRIQVGQNASLTFDAILNKEYQGQVSEVALVGTTSAGVVSFKITIELLDADENVRPGMTAGVNIVVNELQDVLLVPNRAVRLLNGERVVYILDSTSPAPVPVTIQLGVSSETYSEVISGELKVGDEIVLNPPTDFGSFFAGGPPGR